MNGPFQLVSTKRVVSRVLFQKGGPLGKKGRAMIDAFQFGKIIIEGETFSEDLLIFPDGSVCIPWRRRTGHRLVIEDLNAVLDSNAATLVVGTGKPGLMRPDPTLKATLAAHGIEMVAMPTTRAVAEYNARSRHHAGVAACFHLTC